MGPIGGGAFPLWLNKPSIAGAFFDAPVQEKTDRVVVVVGVESEGGDRLAVVSTICSFVRLSPSISDEMIRSMAYKLRML